MATFSMRVYQYTHPEYNERHQVVGMVDIQIHDVNHTLNPTLAGDDILTFVTAITPLFVRDNRLDNPHFQGENEPLGYYIAQDDLPEVRRIIHDGDYSRGSFTIIRNLLAVVATTVTIPHDNFQFYHMQLYLHSDNEQL